MTEDEINAVLSKLQFSEPETEAPRPRLSEVSLSRPRIDESLPVTFSPSRDALSPMASSMMSMTPSASGRVSIPAFGGEVSAQGGYMPTSYGKPLTHHGFSFEKKFADGGHVDAALHLLRQHFDEGGFLDSLRSLFSGDDYQSTGDKVVKDGEVQWGNPDIAADFFRADKADLAMRNAPKVGRPEDDVTGSVPMPRPRPAPEAPAVSIPFEAPKAGVGLPEQAKPDGAAAFPYTGFRAVPPDFAMPSPVAPDLPAPRAAPDVRPMAYAPATVAAQAPALQAINAATSPLDIRDISHLSEYRGSAMENPQAVVFHHTAGEGTPEGVVNTLNTRKDPFTGRPMTLGAHYIIDRDGSIHSALPPGTRGAHIMPSKINDLSNYNTYGVEVIAKDNNDITPEQIAAGQRLYTHLSAGRSEPLGIFGHGELNPGHKQADEGLAIVNPIRTAASPVSATDAAVDTARKVTNRAVNYPEITDQEKDLIAKTIAAEASGKSPEEAHAIANVILNRAIAGGRYGKSIRDILLAENQFEPWSDESNANYPMKFKPGMPAYDAGAAALQKAYDAGDITGGSTYFWAPRAQGRLGRDVPGFARKYPGFNIGATRFHRETREEGGEVEEHASGGKAISKAMKAVSELFDSPGMTQWREKSVIPASKVEDRYYTGTSKDKDFPSFNVGRHGAWFTKDPAEASSYAKENDSKGFKAEGWKMVPVNTADRVIPAYLRAENPFTGPRPESVMSENYKKAQSDWFDQLRSQGHDAWMPESAPNLAVILKEPSQIKSAISNSGDFDLNAPRTDRDAGGEVNDALRVVREHHADGEAVGQAPFFTFEPTPDSVDRQAARQPAYNPAERTWSDAGSTEGERLTRALGVEGELPKGETFMSAQPSGWDKYKPQRVPGTFLKRWGEAADENIQSMSEGYQAAKQGNYGAGALGMLGGAFGAAISPLTGMERVLVRDPYLRMTGNLKDAQAAEMVADAALTGGMRGPAKQLLGKGVEGMATDPWARMRMPSPAATGAATAAGAMLAPEDAEASKLSKAMEVARMAIPRELSPLGFYSHGAEAARGLAQAKGTAQQFTSMLDKAGIRGPEMESYLQTFGGRPIVTREEIAKHFQDTMPQIEETVLGGRKPVLSETEKEKWIDAQAAERARETGDIDHVRDWANASPEIRDWHREEAIKNFNERMVNDFGFAEQFNDYVGTPTKFGQYTLPGGENYREIALTLPGEEIYRAPAGHSMGDKADINRVAHLRMSDRTGPNGEKILHVEEIQSDWGQKGKKEGFVNPQDKANMPNLIKQYDELNAQRHDFDRMIRYGDDADPAIQKAVAQRVDVDNQMQALSDRMTAVRSNIPTAPYVTNTQAWTDLALKRALREAAEGGYDKLVWTPGAEQAKRYSLSSHVDALKYIKEPDGTFSVIPVKNNQNLHNLEKSNVSDKELESLFGRDVAEKMKNNDGSKNGDFRVLSGQDLEMGGEGMKGYYDKIVPNQLSKLVKKLDPEAKIGVHDLITKKGGKVADEAALNENSQLIEQGRFWDDARAENVSGYRVTSPGGQELGVFENLPDAHDALLQVLGSAKEPDTILKVPSLTITPAMRESILRGQSAHARGGEVMKGEEMRDHFEGGGLKLVNKLANKRAKIGHNGGPSLPKVFPEVAERYPLTKEPVEAFDKNKGEYYLAKDLTPEALAIQKARKAALASVAKGDYVPFFDPAQRFDVDPTKYPNYTPTTSVLTKQPATQAKYDAIAGSPEASTRLDEAYARGLQQQKAAENWYFMGQLEQEFIKEYGPDLGRQMFKQRFADPMAATTGGADPTSNLMMAHYGNYLKEKGLPIPDNSYEYPFPIGGRYAAGNMKQYDKMIMQGQGITHDNPKRYNFSYDFMGKKGPTIDEQMSQMFDPKMNMPPAGTYGHYENALANRAANAGVDPRYFQEVAWAGKKDADSKTGFKAQPMIGIVNEAIERTHQITGMPRDEIVRRGLVRAEIPLYGAAGATAAGAMGPEFMQGQGEAPAPEAAEAPMTEERKRGGSIVDRALMLVSR